MLERQKKEQQKAGVENSKLLALYQQTKKELLTSNKQIQNKKHEIQNLLSKIANGDKIREELVKKVRESEQLLKQAMGKQYNIVEQSRKIKKTQKDVVEKLERKISNLQDQINTNQICSNREKHEMQRKFQAALKQLKQRQAIEFGMKQTQIKQIVKQKQQLMVKASQSQKLIKQNEEILNKYEQLNIKFKQSVQQKKNSQQKITNELQFQIQRLQRQLKIKGEELQHCSLDFLKANKEISQLRNLLEEKKQELQAQKIKGEKAKEQLQKKLNEKNVQIVEYANNEAKKDKCVGQWEEKNKLMQKRMQNFVESEKKLVSRVAELMQDIKKKKEENEEIDNKLKEVNQRRAEQIERHKKQLSQMEKLKMDMCNEKERLGQNEKKLQEYRIEIEKMKKEQQMKIKLEKRQKEEQQSIKSKLMKQIIDLKDQLRILSSIKSNSIKYEEECLKLKKLMVEKESQIESKQAIIKEKQRLIQAKSELFALEISRNQTINKIELDKLQNQLKQNKFDRIQYTSQIAQLHGQINLKNKQIQTLLDKLEYKNQQSSKREAVLVQLSRVKDQTETKLKQCCGKYEKKINELVLSMEELKFHIKSLENVLQSEEDAKKQLKGIILHNQQQIKNLEEQLKDLAKQKVQREQQITDLQAQPHQKNKEEKKLSDSKTSCLGDQFVGQFIEIDKNALLHICDLLGIEPEEGQILKTIIDTIESSNFMSIQNNYRQILFLFGVDGQINEKTQEKLILEVRSFRQTVVNVLDEAKKSDKRMQYLSKQNHRLNKQVFQQQIKIKQIQTLTAMIQILNSELIKSRLNKIDAKFRHKWANQQRSSINFVKIKGLEELTQQDNFNNIKNHQQ